MLLRGRLVWVWGCILVFALFGWGQYLILSYSPKWRAVLLGNSALGSCWRFVTAPANAAVKYIDAHGLFPVGGEVGAFLLVSVCLVTYWGLLGYLFGVLTRLLFSDDRDAS
jgi:hypothetical protein